MSRVKAAALICAAWGISAAARANGLMDAYQLAKKHDPTYQAAQYVRDATLEAMPQARAAVLPQLGGQYGFSDNRLHVLDSGANSFLGPQPANYYTQKNESLGISQTLFDWSAFETISKARVQKLQAEAAYRSAEQSLIYRTATAYFGVLQAWDTLRADVDAEFSYKIQYDQAQHKYDVGYVAITDALNAEASYDSASATVIVDRLALGTAKRALTEITGAPVEEISGLQDDIPLSEPLPAAEDEWVKLALKENPDVLTAFYTGEAARKDVSIARAKYLPTLAANGGLTRTDSHANTGSDSITDTIGITATWNLPTNGLVQSQVRQANDIYQEQEQALEGQRRTTDKAAKDAYEGVITGIASVKADKHAVVSNQKSVEASEIGLKVGTRTQTDVLIAEQNLATAEKTYYVARYSYLTSALALKQAAGHLTDADLAEIDHLMTIALQTDKNPEPTPLPKTAAESAIDQLAPATPNAPAAATPGAVAPSAVAPSAAAPIAAAEPGAAQATALLAAWAQAWSAGDVTAYLSYYAADFKPEGGISRAQWEAQRRLRVGTAAHRSVTIVNPLVTRVDAHHLRVNFVQDYRSGALSQKSDKILELSDASGSWKISREISR
jgi:outer membrane protein